MLLLILLLGHNSQQHRELEQGPDLDDCELLLHGLPVRLQGCHHLVHQKYTHQKHFTETQKCSKVFLSMEKRNIEMVKWQKICKNSLGEGSTKRKRKEN